MSGGRGGGGRQIAQQHHLSHRPGLSQVQRMVRAGRVVPRPGEAWRRRVPDEERGDDQLQLVHEPAGQELGAQAGAPLHHDPAHPAPGQVGQDRRELRRVAAVNHLGQAAERSLSFGSTGVAA